MQPVRHSDKLIAVVLNVIGSASGLLSSNAIPSPVTRMNFGRSICSFCVAAHKRHVSMKFHRLLPIAIASAAVVPGSSSSQTAAADADTEGREQKGIMSTSSPTPSSTSRLSTSASAHRRSHDKRPEPEEAGDRSGEGHAGCSAKKMRAIPEHSEVTI